MAEKKCFSIEMTILVFKFLDSSLILLILKVHVIDEIYF